MRTACLVLAQLLLALRGFAYQDLGLLPVFEDAARDTESLSMSERLAMVDLLEEEIYEFGTANDSLRAVLAAHYAGSPLMKHRVWALEVHKEFEDPAAPEVLLSKSQLYERTFNPWSSRRAIEEAIAESPEESMTHRFEGAHYMNLGRHALDRDLLARAQSSYEEAVACEDAGYDDWLGLASVLLARGDRVALAAASARLMELRPEDPAALLYDAIALDALGLSNSSELRFRAAMARMKEETRERFSDFETYLDQIKAIHIVPEDMDSSAPSTLLEWWTRLVECEVLFGAPRAHSHGWDSYVGNMYLLLGRPTEHAYYPAMGIPSVTEIVALNRWHRHKDELARQLMGVNTDFDGVWIWIANIGKREFPFVFQKGAQFASWAPNVPTQTKWAKVFANSAPLNLLRKPESPRATPMLRARHARFASAFGDARVECCFSVAVPEALQAEGLTVRWDLLRVDGQETKRIDRVESGLTQQPMRADLLEQLSPAAMGGSTRLGQFSAVLDAGSYLARLELRDADGTVLQGADERFELRARRDAFHMSDLVLADSFAPLREMPETPAEFVRHGQAIVPHPEYQALPGLDRLHIYYEVYGAQVDEKGNSHLDVLYEVFPALDYDPYEAGRFDESSGTAPAIRLRHRDDLTGQTASGTTVRGTFLRLEDLEPGHYVLVVSVNDRLSQQETRQTLSFAR